MTSIRRLFLIGASAGGVSAVHRIVESLDDEFSAPLVVVQHLPPSNIINVEAVYGHYESRTLVEIEDKMPIEHRHIYFSPGGYHVLVERDFTFSLSLDEPVHFSRPSIDVLFTSVAQSYGKNAFAALMTGANSDGAEGLKAIQLAGGTTIVQDVLTAEHPEMPSAALRLIKPDYVVAIDELAALMMRLSRGDSM